MGSLIHKIRPLIGISALAVMLLLSVVSLSVPAFAQSGSVPVFLDPPSVSLSLGQVTDVSIKIDASTQPVDTAQAFLDFDPALLQVVDAGGLPASLVEFGPLISTGSWTQPLLNQVDNATGRIGVAAGKGPPAGGGVDANSEFVLAIVRFKALADGDDAHISFDVEDNQTLQRTKVYSQGSELTGPDTGATITILAGVSPTPTLTPVPKEEPPTPAPIAAAPAPAPVVGGGGGGAAGYVLPTPSSGGTLIVEPPSPPVAVPEIVEPDIVSPTTVPPIAPPVAVLPDPVVEPEISEIQPEVDILEPPTVYQEDSGLSSPPQVVSDEGGNGFGSLLLYLAIGLGLLATVGVVILTNDRLKDMLLEAVESVKLR